MDTKNVAAVMVTADLPAFAAAGSQHRRDGLGHGRRQEPARRHPDGDPAAGRRRPGLCGGAGHGADRLGLGFGRLGLVDHPRRADRRAASPSGGTVEREVGFQLDQMPIVRLTLRNPDFTTSRHIADAINGRYPGSAESREPHGGRAEGAPQARTWSRSSPRWNSCRSMPTAPAKVVIDEVNGVVVMGDDVRVSTVAIAQGNLTISVQETPQVSASPRRSARARPRSSPQSQVSGRRGEGQEAAGDQGGRRRCRPWSMA